MFIVKKRFFSVLCLLVAVCSLLISCGQPNTAVPLWDSALYVDNTTFGDGEKTLMVEVVAEEKSVIFTLNTDAETVGEALLEHELIAGEQGAYGLYVKQVNGMTADYDIDQSYWSFTKNGEPLMTGVDGEKFVSGDRYELVYMK